MKRRYCPSGDSMLLVEFPEEISPAVHSQVLSLVSALEATPIGGVVEWIPAYRSLGVVYDPNQISYHDLVAQLKELERFHVPVTKSQSRYVEVPVCYGGDMGPDLDFVARYNRLSAEEVIHLHSGADYRVYLLGFTPGFPYLGGLPERITAPRLDEPRLRVPAGSVAIGGNQTGIYPIESPGGWRLVGRTPLRLFDLNRRNPFLFNAGDSVRFRAVSAEEFRSLQAPSE